MATKQGLASVGIDVKLGENSLNYVTNISDIGGAPSDLDSTCMKDKMKHTVGGVKDAGNFDIDILFDNSDEQSDYRVVKGLEDAGNAVDVEVKFPDNTTFKSKALVYITVNGAGVDELIKAKISCKLQADWEVTNPLG